MGFYREMNEIFLRNYCGLLFDFCEFSQGEDVSCTFDFDDPMLEVLRKSYPILKIAGKGSDFERARRLNHFLAPKLKHNPDFALKEKKSVPQDALSLLEYSLNRPEHSINCVAKSLILTACCLAAGIYARRVSLYPASPYDEDNHVVTEIYDKALEKWVMIDATSDGYFSDGHIPLSVLEMREHFANLKPISVILPRQDPHRLEELLSRNTEWNQYYAKNLFYLSVETHASLKGSGEEVYLVPKGLDVKKRMVRFAEHLARGVDLDGPSNESYRKLLNSAASLCPRYGTAALWNAPIKNI